VGEYGSLIEASRPDAPDVKRHWNDPGTKIQWLTLRSFYEKHFELLREVRLSFKLEH
jgi:hypothetical protein